MGQHAAPGRQRRRALPRGGGAGRRRPRVDVRRAPGRDVPLGARAAIAAGLQPGDRAAIWAPNSAEWVLAALGVQAAGGVLVPSTPGSRATRPRGCSARAAPACCSPSTASSAPTTSPSCGARRVDLPALETDRGPRRGRHPTARSSLGRVPRDRRRRCPPANAEARAAAITADDLADILFTSGTTGRPKGAMTTHGQNLRVFEVYTAALGSARGRPLPDRQPVLPQLRLQGRAGCRRSCAARRSSPSPCSTSRRCSTGSSVSASPCSPDHRRCCRASSTTPTATATTSRRCGSRSPGRRRSRSSSSSASRRRRPSRRSSPATGSPRRARSCRCAATTTTPRRSRTGRADAIPDIEVRVVDDDGRRGAARRGRARSSSGATTSRPATGRSPSRRRRRSMPRAGCTPATSAIMNDRDYVKITDRKKDMFIVGGFNAYPAEIENMLLGFDKVAQVAVVGDPRRPPRRGGRRVRDLAARGRAHRRGGRRVVTRAHGELQGPAPGRDRRRAPAQREREGAEVRVARPAGRPDQDERSQDTP